MDKNANTGNGGMNTGTRAETGAEANADARGQTGGDPRRALACAAALASSVESGHALADGFARRLALLARRAGASGESVRWVERAAFALSRATSEGHVCAPLAVLAHRYGVAQDKARAALRATAVVTDLGAAVHTAAASVAMDDAAMDAVAGAPDDLMAGDAIDDAIRDAPGDTVPASLLRPLVIDADGRLYLARYYDYERRLARALVAHAGLGRAHAENGGQAARDEGRDHDPGAPLPGVSADVLFHGLADTQCAVSSGASATAPAVAAPDASLSLNDAQAALPAMSPGISSAASPDVSFTASSVGLPGVSPGDSALALPGASLPLGASFTALSGTSALAGASSATLSGASLSPGVSSAASPGASLPFSSSFTALSGTSPLPSVLSTTVSGASPSPGASRDTVLSGVSARALPDALADALRVRLLKFFGAQQDESVDWQRVAAVLALSGRLTIVSGGPGTGKTTTVAGVLACLLDAHRPSSPGAFDPPGLSGSSGLSSPPGTSSLSGSSGLSSSPNSPDPFNLPNSLNPSDLSNSSNLLNSPDSFNLSNSLSSPNSPNSFNSPGSPGASSPPGSPDLPDLRIALAAPTGKAAQRMLEALYARAAHLPSGLAARLPRTSYTLHRLLGQGPDGQFRYRRENPLPYDVVVIDEASMIDVALAAHLFDALAPATRLVMLGDKDQLAAVEAGAVFAELSAQPSFSDAMRARLARALGVKANVLARALQGIVGEGDAGSALAESPMPVSAPAAMSMSAQTAARQTAPLSSPPATPPFPMPASAPHGLADELQFDEITGAFRSSPAPHAATRFSAPGASSGEHSSARFSAADALPAPYSPVNLPQPGETTGAPRARSASSVSSTPPTSPISRAQHAPPASQNILQGASRGTPQNPATDDNPRNGDLSATADARFVPPLDGKPANARSSPAYPVIDTSLDVQSAIPSHASQNILQGTSRDTSQNPATDDDPRIGDLFAAADAGFTPPLDDKLANARSSPAYLVIDTSLDARPAIPTHVSQNTLQDTSQNPATDDDPRNGDLFAAADARFAPLLDKPANARSSPAYPAVATPPDARPVIPSHALQNTLQGIPQDEPQNTPPHGLLTDCVVWLVRNYRFGQTSAIGQAADAIRRGAVRDALDALARDPQAAALHEDAGVTLSGATLARLDAGFAPYREALARALADGGQADPAPLFDALNRFRVLCATRAGGRGVEQLNAYLGARVAQAAYSAQHAQAAQNTWDARNAQARRAPSQPAAFSTLAPWFAGRPVMVTRNDYALGLFNGDVGIALPGDESAGGALRVWFRGSDGRLGDAGGLAGSAGGSGGAGNSGGTRGFGRLRAVSPAALPPHDTAFALTVHKSQGSEFDHVALVLPAHGSAVLTRELVYTAITRARVSAHVYGARAVLAEAIATPTRRDSGLAARIAGFVQAQQERW